MAAATQFVRFHVLLSGEWAGQCERCGSVLFAQNERELSLAEAAHECQKKKPNASVSDVSIREKRVSQFPRRRAFGIDALFRWRQLRFRVESHAMLITGVLRLDDKTTRGHVILERGCSVRVINYRQFEFGAEMPCPVHEGECFVSLLPEQAN